MECIKENRILLFQSSSALQVAILGYLYHKNELQTFDMLSSSNKNLIYLLVFLSLFSAYLVYLSIDSIKYGVHIQILNMLLLSYMIYSLRYPNIQKISFRNLILIIVVITLANIRYISVESDGESSYERLYGVSNIKNWV